LPRDPEDQGTRGKNEKELRVKSLERRASSIEKKFRAKSRKIRAESENQKLQPQ